MTSRGAQRCACQCHWDLSWLVFGKSKISAGDADGLFVIERNGYFLYLETKGEDEELTWGQDILLKALSRVPRFTVLLIRGPKGYPRTVVPVRRGQYGLTEQTDREDFQRRVDKWYERANSRPK